MEKFPDVKAYVEDRKVLTVEIRSKFSSRAILWLKDHCNNFLEKYKCEPPVQHTANMVGDNIRRILTFEIDEERLYYCAEKKEWRFK